VVADRMFVKGCAPNQRFFFAREQAGHEPSMAFEILTRRLRQPLNDVGTQLIARITGAAADDPITLIRMLSLHGQVLIFHATPRRAARSRCSDRRRSMPKKASCSRQSCVLRRGPCSSIGVGSVWRACGASRSPNHAVASPEALHAAVVRAEIAHVGKAGDGSRLQHDRCRQCRANARNRVQ
jgi:hypothetical protein